MTQTVKNSPATWETGIESLGWEDPLEEGMAACSSMLAGESPWAEEPGGLQSMGPQRDDTTERAHTHTYTHKQKHIKQGVCID